MESYPMRTWIDVDLDRLIENYRTACAMADDAVATCVVKANAYGHGAVRVAQALSQVGCRSFAVSCVREALELRRAGIDADVLVMGVAERELLPEAIRQNLILTAASLTDIQAIEQAAAGQCCPVRVHLKVDTGFHRLGLPPMSEARVAELARTLKWARLTGLYSHLALTDREHDITQYRKLMWYEQNLRDRGVEIRDIHLLDSIGLVRYPGWTMSRVRVGALLYGVRPYHSEHLPFECHETLTFRTTVAQVREVGKGEIVGYGDEPLTRFSRVATLCAGYGDGYPRSLSNGKGKVCIRGRLAPVVGLICMDQMMVDVTDIPGVRPGDTADLLGGGIPYDDVATWAGTNRNECLSILSRRPIRVYHQGGRVVTILDELLHERRDDP